MAISRWGLDERRTEACTRILQRSRDLKRTAGNGRDQQNAIAFLEAAGFAPKEADVLFVEIDVEELADLAAFVADVAGQIGEARGEIRERFGDGGGTTINLGRAVGKATEGRGDFNSYWHFILRLPFSSCSLFAPR